MKLTLSHADVTVALCEFLKTRGMTAFDPTQVTAEFSFKRGSKELLCELDTEPKAPVQTAEVKPQAEAPIAPEAETPAPVAETLADAEVPASEPVPVEPEAPAADGDDNLFD